MSLRHAVNRTTTPAQEMQMLDEMDKRIKTLEEEVALLNTKANVIMLVCLQQRKEIHAMTALLEELVVAVPLGGKDDMMASLARDIQKARSSSLN
jgi:hypothetical protein